MGKLGKRREMLVVKLAAVLLVSFWFLAQVLGHSRMSLLEGFSEDLLNQLTAAQLNASLENEWLLQLHPAARRSFLGRKSNRWDSPQNTHTWVVMIDGNHRQVEAQSTEWDSFEQPRDCILMWVLHRYQSIPSNRIHLLNQGRQEILQRIRSIVEGMFDYQKIASESGGLEHPLRLIFYFQGHSSLRGLGTSDATEMTLDDLSEVFSRMPKGSELVVHADSCFTGILSNLTVPEEITVAVLTSAHQMSLSTETWAFTDCLIRVYSGDETADSNGDGWITAAEAYKFCRVVMVVGSHQMIGGTEESAIVLAPTQPAAGTSLASGFFEQKLPGSVAKQMGRSAKDAECGSLSTTTCPRVELSWREITEKVLLPRIRCTAPGKKAVDRLCSNPILPSGKPVLLPPRQEVGRIGSCVAGLCHVRLNSDWWSIWALVSDNATNCVGSLAVVEERIPCGFEHFLRGIPCHQRRGAVIICQKDFKKPQREPSQLPQEQEWVRDPTLNLWYSTRTGNFHNGRWELDLGSGRWFESRLSTQEPHSHHHHRHHKDHE